MQAPNSSPAPSFAITVDDLGKRFNREWIFRRLSRQFTQGTTYAVTGPNGSGKSTLLQVLWGQVPPSKGVLRFDNARSEVAQDNLFSHVAIAAPYMDLIEEFTLLEMLRFHFTLRTIRPGFSVDDLVRILYMEDARDKQVMNFSSGMKQRLKLAMAFYTQADAYFFDEPGTNLDRRAFEWYKREFDLLPGSCIRFVASNDPDEYPQNAEVIDILRYKK